MACCTGKPTSTFGGGGGTKLFCSQAPSATDADSARTMRETAATFCLMAPFNSAAAGERAGFMSVPQFIVCQKRFCSAEDTSPSETSNNPLAVELES